MAHLTSLKIDIATLFKHILRYAALICNKSDQAEDTLFLYLRKLGTNTQTGQIEKKQKSGGTIQHRHNNETAASTVSRINHCSSDEMKVNSTVVSVAGWDEAALEAALEASLDPAMADYEAHHTDTDIDADPDADAATALEEEDEADILSVGLSPVQLSLPPDVADEVDAEADADADIGADVKAELDRANAIPDSVDNNSNEATATDKDDDPIVNE